MSAFPRQYTDERPSQELCLHKTILIGQYQSRSLNVWTSEPVYLQKTRHRQIYIRAQLTDIMAAISMPNTIHLLGWSSSEFSS